MKKKIDLFGEILDIYSEDSVSELSDEILKTNANTVIIRLNDDSFTYIHDALDVKNTISRADMILCSNEDMGANKNNETNIYKEVFNILKGESVILIAENPEIIDELKDFLLKNYEGINIKATKIYNYDESFEGVINFINNYVPSAVIVALRSPIQERLICENKSYMNTKLCMGIGEKPEILGYTRGRLSSLFKSKVRDVKKTILSHEIKGE